jgi:MFS family permease
MNSDAQNSRAQQLAGWNAALWGVGNGLATTTLITYLAGEYGARGLATSLILAAPQLVGLLRQATPRLIYAVGSRSRFCLTTYGVSAGLLAMLPIVSAPGVLPDSRSALAALVMLFCAYQLCEYLATVALWSWLGDLCPEESRGTFLGNREAWLSGGRLLGMLVSGLFTFAWPQWYSKETLWQAYSLCNVAGAVMLGLAIVPLGFLPARERDRQAAPPQHSWWRLFFTPLGDARFLPLVAYGCWLGAVNGLLGASQFFFSKRVLGLSLLVMLAMRCQIELGQTVISAPVGRWIDRVGNWRVMVASQLIVALAMVFYLTATAQQWWWIFGASTLFIAYAGLNVGIPNLLLHLAPPQDRNAYVASHYAWAGLAYGLGSLSGGQLYDLASERQWSIALGGLRLDHFAIIFAAGLLLRAAGVLWIAAIPEKET